MSFVEYARDSLLCISHEKSDISGLRDKCCPIGTVQDGHAVSIRLKIGEMTCLEYAAMKGYAAILAELMSKSVCHEILRQYFALDGEECFVLHKCNKRSNKNKKR